MGDKRFRTEKDSMGEVTVSLDKLWGVQTQRSLENFPIGHEKMPRELISAIALIKQCAAEVNVELGVLDPVIARAIQTSAQEILDGKLWDHFPLVVWQTGSGTHTNMNVNEVVASRASQILGFRIHSYDHVNASQSSNDVFPSALHLALTKVLEERLLPSLERLQNELEGLAKKFGSIVKIGRTHLQDATPLTIGQEVSGWKEQLAYGFRSVREGLSYLQELPIGGTSVGTGMNAPKGYSAHMCRLLSEKTGYSFVPARSTFALQAGKEGVLIVSASLRTLAMSLYYIGNTIRFLASGPRCGIGELILPVNEPGSSIMPGKTNPTQIEALCMVCVEVMGNDHKVSFAASQGHFQLNTYMPLIGYTLVSSANLLTDTILSFTERCVKGMRPHEKRIRKRLENSLMLVTALTPHIGYEKSAEIAQKAFEEWISLKTAAVELGYVTERQFDEWVDVGKMV